MEEDEKIEISLPEDFEIKLDEFDEEEDDEEEDMGEAEPLAEEAESDSIEEIVSETPASSAPDIPMSSDFAPQQFIAPQPSSPVLERRPIPEPVNLESELPETQTTTPETAGQETKPYEPGSDYYAGKYQEFSRDPEIIDPANPTLQQDFTRMQQPRFAPTDTSWGAPRTEDWEKKYEVRFKETKRDRRRM